MENLYHIRSKESLDWESLQPDSAVYNITPEIMIPRLYDGKIHYHPILPRNRLHPFCDDPNYHKTDKYAGMMNNNLVFDRNLTQKQKLSLIYQSKDSDFQHRNV
ncbi:MAG: hypothetical protein KDH96_09825 [Candidatus Riesia sp.]|nr:hypothetical protein [Candidatus Riesia sp.]